MGLLAAEMTARTGHDPNWFYASVTQDLGQSFYARIDAPATPEQKARLAKLDPAEVDVKDLAGEPIEAKLTQRPATTNPSAGSRWSLKTAGLPPGRREPRMSTRFTQKASAARSISGRSSAMRRLSSPAMPRRNDFYVSPMSF